MASLRALAAALIVSTAAFTTATTTTPAASAPTDVTVDHLTNPHRFTALANSTGPHRTADLLLTEPFLQNPTEHSVTVVWFTETPGLAHAVITNAPTRTCLPGRVHIARTTKLSRTAEDATSLLPDGAAPTAITPRPIYRHEAVVTGLAPGCDVPYQALSIANSGYELTASYTLSAAPSADDDLTILLTSDHQAKPNTPANLEWAAKTLGDIDAVFFAGDLVNVPDRASEWFDSTNQLAFFPGLQGTAAYKAANGRAYAGGPIIQNAPLYPIIGNHEVMGARAMHDTLNDQFNGPVPRDAALAEYDKVAHVVNPTDDETVKATWLEDRSYSCTTYEEIFTLPESEPGGERYYATTVGNTRLIALYVTRIWRSPDAEPDPAARTTASRYQEAADTLDTPLRQGHGEFPFESIAADSAQHDWLQAELASTETQAAEHVVVMMHESPQTLGGNAMPHFGQPQRSEETGEHGTVTGIRYDYPASGNMIIEDVLPLLEESGVDLVLNGHNHVWNRFRSASGTNYLETANVGNSYGAFHPDSGKERPTPPAPWDPNNYVAQGSPAGLTPITPTEQPLLGDHNFPLPFVESNDYTVFSALNTGSGEVTSWIVNMTDPDATPQVLDRFTLGEAPSMS